MRTVHHLAAALMDAGMSEQGADRMATEAFASTDTEQFLRNVLTRTELELCNLTIQKNAVRDVLAGKRSELLSKEATLR